MYVHRFSLPRCRHFCSTKYELTAGVGRLPTEIKELFPRNKHLSFCSQCPSMSKQDSLEIKSMTFHKDTLTHILCSECDSKDYTVQLHTALLQLQKRMAIAASSQAQSRAQVKSSVSHSHHSHPEVPQSCDAASSSPRSLTTVNSSAAASSHAQSTPPDPWPTTWSYVARKRRKKSRQGMQRWFEDIEPYSSEWDECTEF